MSEYIQDEIPLWVRTSSGVAFSQIPTHTNGKLPSFAIIGSAKCGTTALTRFLEQHPQIHMCLIKEPHFFSTDVIYNRGIEWYKGLYHGAKEGQILGEASTSYSFYPMVSATPERIYRVIPDIKLIYLLREPIARVESAVMQEIKYRLFVMKEKLEPKSVDEMLEQDNYNILVSQYISQIEQYMQYFAKSQLHIVFQDDLKKNPTAALTKIFHFLGVDSSFSVDTKGEYNRTSDFIHGINEIEFTNRFSQQPAFSFLKKRLPKSVKSTIRNLWIKLRGNSVIAPMSSLKKRALKEHFRPYNRELELFLGRKLTEWD